MWKMFCWGLLAGWLIEWAIDWLFWRRNTVANNIGNGTGMTGAGLASGLASNHTNAGATLVNDGSAASSGTVVASATHASGSGVPSYADTDLEAIEGIGPKIAELFRNNGITNFKQLSEAPMDHLVKILDAGGARFKLANPQTWAEQAKLASTGQWAAFAALKAELVGGQRLSANANDQ